MQQLAEEIRREIVEKVSVKGGHLAPNLGVVELTMALHYVFDTPKDLLVWDIGHQAYVHKLLTGRRDRFHTIRKFGGLSVYRRCEESPIEVFGAIRAYARWLKDRLKTFQWSVTGGVKPPAGPRAASNTFSYTERAEPFLKNWASSSLAHSMDMTCH